MHEDYFISSKKTTGGFSIVVVFFDSEKQNANIISKEKMLSDKEVGIKEVEAIQSLIFDYIESFGIPDRKTTFYTQELIYDIVRIDVVNNNTTGKSIHFNIYCWG